jgi:hypothetical protein
MNFNFINANLILKMVVTFYGLASLLRRMSILLLSIKFSGSIDLVNDQLTGSTDAIRNTYSKKFRLRPNWKWKGFDGTNITFDIVLPDGNNSVSEVINTTQETNCQQPTELNKQVFALLLLNRFIGENPFASEAGGSSVDIERVKVKFCRNSSITWLGT